MFIVNEIQELRPSGVRYRLMEDVDKIIPENIKEFTFDKSDNVCVVVCDLLDNDEGYVIQSFVENHKNFSDCLRHIKRQALYYAKHRVNYYTGENMEKCV